MTRREQPGGMEKEPRLPAERAAAAGDVGHGGDQGQHGLDALADEERSDAVGVRAEAHGEAVDAAEGLPRRGHVRLGIKI